MPVGAWCCVNTALAPDFDTMDPAVSILRHVRKDGYTTIPNETLQDRRLSYTDRGVLAYMLSLPADWRFSADRIAAACDVDGRTKVLSALKRLEQCGYLNRSKHRVAGGRYNTVVKVSDWPIKSWSKEPASGFPTPVDPTPDDRTPDDRTSENPPPIQKTQTEDTDTGVCVVDGGAAAASAPSGSDIDTLITRHWDGIRAVIGAHLTDKLRRKIERPEDVSSINGRIAALLESGWSPEHLVAQLKARATMNGRTVRVAQILLDALEKLEPLAPNTVVDDPWAIDDDKEAVTVVDPPGFAEFWDAYGYKIGKAKAREAFAGAVNLVELTQLLTAVASYRAYLDATGTPQAHASTWLNQHRWNDDYGDALATGRARRPDAVAPAEPARPSLSARRNREVDAAVAAFEAEAAAASDTLAWDGGIVDTAGRPA